MILFTIPTNRKIDEALLSVKMEMEAVKRNRGLDSQLLIVDNSEHSIATSNLETIKNSGVKVFYCNVVIYEKMVHLLSIELGLEESLLRNLLIPYSTDYGKVFNWIFLLAASLDANTIHRRDSDCIVEGLLEKDYPIFKEMDYIGKKVRDLNDDIDIIDKVDYCDDVIRITGSGYYGDWDLDVGKMSNRKAVLNTINALSNLSSKESMDKIIHRYENTNDTSKKDILKTRYRINEHIECGNICIQDIYNYIPNVPGRFGIGYDCFCYLISFMLKVPILIHKSKIVHRYERDREKTNPSLNYWIGVIKMLNYKLLTMELSGILYGDTNVVEKRTLRDWDHTLCFNNNLDGIDNVKYYSGDKLYSLIMNSSNKINRDEMIHQYETVVKDILNKEENPNRSMIAATIYEHRFDLVDEAYEDYKSFAMLCKYWRDFIEASKRLSFRDMLLEIN